MKKTTVFGILLYSILAMNLSFAGSLQSITPDEAFKLESDSKAIILDVREPGEISSGKIKGASTIPYSLLRNDVLAWDKKTSDLKKNKMVVVYCRSGGRAEAVGSELAKRGYKV
jgi:rhodanese-related sulfurtransferase